LVVEALSDTMFHFEVSELRQPPANNVIFRSPMVDNTNFDSTFCGPSSLTESSNGYILETPKVRVSVDPSTLSVTVYDKVKQYTLTTFSYAQLAVGQVNNQNNPPSPVLRWTRERAQGIMGLAQAPGLDSADQANPNSEGNWLGTKLEPIADGYKKTRFGNNMFGNNGGALSYTQFPVAYSVAPGGYNHAFFLDDQHGLFWDMTTATHSVTSKGARALRWFAIAGDSLLDIRKQYLNIVGRPLVPTKSWLGLQQSKFGYQSWVDANEEVDALIAAKFPLDTLILDLYWFGADLRNGNNRNTRFGSLAWDTSKFPDPAGSAKALRAKGPGLVLIEEPYIGENGPTFRFLRESNALAKNPTTGQPVVIDYNPW
jgi:alpha-glucosidase